MASIVFKPIDYHCIAYSAKPFLFVEHVYKSMNISSLDSLIVIIGDGFENSELVLGEVSA